MAEFGSRGSGIPSPGGLASPPSSPQGKVAFKAGDGEGGGGGGGGGPPRTHLDPTGNGVSNGDCTLLGPREDPESAQPGSPGLERGYSALHPEGKAGIPRKTSIIKAN